MLPILEKLAILQNHDGQLLDLRREYEGIPARKEQAAARLKDADKRFADAQDRQKHAQSAIRQAELDIEAAKEKADRLRRQQFEIKSNEQYKVLQGEIAAEMVNIRQIEDREIELMEASEKTLAEVTAQSAARAEVHQTIEEERQSLDRRGAQLQEELARMEAERRQRAEGIEAQWLERYGRLFARVGAHAIVAVEREICSGCHMKLPPQVVQDAKREQTVCTCTFCGRMLYWMA